MKTTGLAVIFICAVSSVASAQNHGQKFTFDNMLERHDRNGDGTVSKEEYRGNPKLFDRLDANKNGSVTREEFDSGFKKRANQLPENVTVHRDLEYAVADGESLKLDLYLPATTNPAPLMVWIHGGGWRSGDKAGVNPAIIRLSSDGYAVASINYRLKDLSIHPKNIHDCKGAVRWLRANADKYGYDPSRVAVGGGSAGGHLSLLLGLSSGVTDLEGTVGGNTNQSSAVKAIVDLYGPSEFSEFAKSSDRFNKAHEIRTDQLKHASPLTYLDKNDPPVLILHGDQDTTVPVEQSILTDKRYKELGLESHLHILEGAGHGGPAFSDEERYQLIKTFLDRHLK